MMSLCSARIRTGCKDRFLRLINPRNPIPRRGIFVSHRGSLDTNAASSVSLANFRRHDSKRILGNAASLHVPSIPPPSETRSAKRSLSGPSVMTPVRDFDAIYLELHSEYPETINTARPVLLAVGIRTEMSEKTDVPDFVLKKWIAWYFSKSNYYALHRRGAVRYNLDGTVAGVVTKEDQDRRDRQVREIHDRKRNQDSKSQTKRGGNRTEMTEGSTACADLPALSARISVLMLEMENSYLVAGGGKEGVSYGDGLFEDTIILMKQAQQLVREGSIRSGTDAPALASLFSQALLIFSSVTPQPDTTRFDACVKILYILRELGISMTPDHYASTVRAACRDGKFRDAAEVFQSQLNIDGGLVPMDNKMGEEYPLEMGLFAVARAAQMEGEDAKEAVLDAANSATMISPRDYDSYILSAISALGRVGEWRACLDFTKSDEGKALGQPLIAIVMNACIQSNQGGEALKLFDKINDTSDNLIGFEWQAAGQFDNLSSECQDAALRSFQSVPPGNNQSALIIFNRAMDSQATLTPEALESAMMACEKDGNWEGAAHMLERMLDRSKDSLDVDFDIDLHVTGDMLASLMRACNSVNEYGVALVYSYFIDLPHRICTEGHSLKLDSQPAHNFVETLLTKHPLLMQCENMLVSTIQSLSGLGLHSHAVHLYEHIIQQTEHASEWPLALRSYRDVLSIIESDPSSNLTSPSACNRALDHLCRLTLAIHSTQTNTATSQLSTLSDAIATSMRLCNEIHHPTAGLVFARRLARTCTPLKPSGVDFVSPSSRDDKVLREVEFLLSDDSLLSATMEAYVERGEGEIACRLYRDRMTEAENETHPPVAMEELLAKWEKSTLQFLEAQIALGDLDAAVVTFGTVSNARHTPESFLSLARSFDTAERWEDLAWVWETAVAADRLTEELGLLALKSTSHLNFQGSTPEKQSRFSSIVQTMARLVRMEPNAWLRSHYWYLKAEISDVDLVRVMRWKKGEIKMGEMNIALEDFNYAIQHCLPPREELFMSLVKRAGYTQRHVRCRGNAIPDRVDTDQYNIQERERLEGIEFIQTLLHHARQTPFGDDPNFTVRVAQGLRALKGHEEVIEFVNELVSRDAQMKPMTFLQAVFVAQTIGDVDLEMECTKLMEDAGFEYKDHSTNFRNNYR